MAPPSAFSSLPPRQATPLFGPGHPRSKPLEISSIATFVPYSSTPSPSADARSTTPSSVLDSPNKLSVDLPPTPSPSTFSAHGKLDAGMPCLWQEWEGAGDATPRRRQGDSLHLQELHQDTRRGRRSSDSGAPPAKVMSSDTAAWPSPGSEPALIRSRTSPASARCEGPESEGEDEHEHPMESPSHLQSLCINFSHVETECQDKELDRDTLEGVHIVPLNASSADPGAEEQVLYALYFASTPDLASLPGDASTKLLFPRWIRGTAVRPSRASQMAQHCAALAPVAHHAQAGVRRGVPSPSSTMSPSTCSPAAKCLATFSEWKSIA